MSDNLLSDLLAVPTAPRANKAVDTQFTSKLEVSEGSASAELRGAVGEVDESMAFELLRRKGENPDDWIVTGFRSSEWTMANGELGESNRYTFRRNEGGATAPADIDELIKIVGEYKPVVDRPTGEHTFIVALGDMQFGKIDGDGVEGTVQRMVDYLHRAADLVEVYQQRFDIGEICIAWMGDHVEGFQSQGGANVWRTPLTLNEQIRLARRGMLLAAQVFAPLADKVTMVAVPGNHGETTRFAGKGVTRYSDSHDTEALVAVGEALQMNPEAFGHVSVYVPDGDDMTVTLNLSGTTASMVHGHQWRPGKAEAWWQGQGFGGSPLAGADLLLAGHLHHFHAEDFGKRTFIQVPALESESSWWKNATGTPGNPGVVVAITKDGRTSPIELVR